MPNGKRAVIEARRLPAGKSRLVVIGDVHGFRRELDALLRQVGYDAGADQLCFVGDLVDGGPDDAGVIDLAMRSGAWAVLGNHDADMLRAAQVPAERHRERGVAWHGRDRFGARGITAEHVAWVAALPHVLRVSGADGDRDVLVVHAGLADGDDITATSVHTATKGRNWGRDWRGPELVVFGHNGFMYAHDRALCIDPGITHGAGFTAALTLPDRRIHVGRPVPDAAAERDNRR